MKTVIKLFLTASLSFFILDMLWLLLISKKLYQDYLGTLLGQVRIGPAALFYVLYVLGMLFFVISPALAKESLSYAWLAGGFLGLLCYATFDLTNLATLRDWPVLITVIDLIWGTVVTAVVSAITVATAHYFNWR